MTAQMIIDRDSGRTFVLFAVSEAEDEYVSVVGSFNDWVPGVDVLHPRGNGTRAAFVEVEHPGDIHFRYLASGTRWFDDPTADIVNEHGSTLLRGDAPPPAVIEPEPTSLTSLPSAPVTKAAAKKAVSKKAVPVKATSDKPVKKATAKKVPAKEVSAKEVSAKVVSAKGVSAKKVPAKKATSSKAAPAKKSAAKKTAKKSPST
jgi:hypothetical protein